MLGLVLSSALCAAETFPRKGVLWAYWGYNRALYSPSNIYLKGPGYELTLNAAQAQDLPNWKLFTDDAQYNYRVGYYLTDRFFVSLGHEHMKYRLVRGQTLSVSGVIDPSASPTLAGNYDLTPIVIGQRGGIIQNFEHTDGLNLLDAEAGITQTILCVAQRRFALSLSGMIGFGMLIPNTDVTFFDVRNQKRYSASGVALSGAISLRADIMKYVFAELKMKGGYMYIGETPTNAGGTARQEAWFLMAPMFLVGVNLPVWAWAKKQAW